MMDAREFIKEHDRLIKVLRDGRAAERHEEAERQARELKMRMARATEHMGNISHRPEKAKRNPEGYPLNHDGY